MLDFHSQVPPTIELAVIRYLPDVERLQRKRGTPPGSKAEMETVQAWPHRGESEVFAFLRNWGNTIVGFRGVAGRAFTSTYVTVVIADQQHAAVYSGGRFSSLVPVNHTLRNDIGSQTRHDVHLHRQRYGSLKSREETA